MSRVLCVQSRKEWIIEEYLFTLNPLDFVLDPVLLPIPRIPFKFDYFWYKRQGDLRFMYIDNIYTNSTLSSVVRRNTFDKLPLAIQRDYIDK